MKILIFKSDKLGDFINISSVLKNLYNSKYEIDIVCSTYNYEIVKYFNFIKNIYIKEPFVKFLFKNNEILKKDYDVILQLDGKKWSYLIASIIKSKKKYAIKYLKEKKIGPFLFKSQRPFLIYNFFFKFIVSNENYNVKNNNDFHYLNLYYKILDKINIKYSDKKHFFPESEIPEIENLKKYKDFILIHFDEKWLSYDANYYNQFKNILKKISINSKVLITSNKDNIFLNEYKNKFHNIALLYDTKLDDLIYLSKNCSTLISMHAGLLIHLCACFDKKIIDIIDEKKFKEIDRWVPVNCNYNRIGLNNLESLLTHF